MSTIAEIREAIAKLSLEEQAELAAELCGWTDDDWDRQMKADVAAGKLAAMDAQNHEDWRAGRCLPLDENL
jgi:hypothetical protein